MNRRYFLYSSCALAVTAGATSLMGCSSDDPDSGNPGTVTPRFTADLTADLISVGNYKSQNNIIVVRIATGNVPASFAALTSICTHEGCTIGYQSSSNQFVCPCHGSRYSISGSVLQGPASAPLAKYIVKIENSILTVS